MISFQSSLSKSSHLTVSVLQKILTASFLPKLLALVLTAILFNDISYTMNKANKVLGSMKRSVGIGNSNVFSTLYESLVRLILVEYETPVSCSLSVKDASALENVQQRASRLALNYCKEAYVLMKTDANC